MTERAPSVSELRRFVPLGGLSTGYLEQIAQGSRVVVYAAGDPVRPPEDLGDTSGYLAEGRVTIDGAAPMGAEDRSALHPLPLAGVRAESTCRIIWVDRNRVSTLLILADPADPSDRDAGDAWMGKLLNSELFSRIPPANVQRVVEVLEPVSMKAGDVVLRQGDPGDYYYIVRTGSCSVTCRANDDSHEMKLATLGSGEGFGEEALVRDATRNATVTMVEPGVLMRMTKDSFVKLIHDPIINVVNREQAERLVESGALWLDVRLPEEHGESGIPESLNLSLAALRAGTHGLDRNREYVVYCNSGRRSAAATFLLAERGIVAWVLQGGLLAANPSAPPVENLQAKLLIANSELEAALRHKAETDAAHADEPTAVTAAHREASENLAARRARIDEESKRAAEALAAAQRAKLELEAEIRKIEAETAAEREKAQALIEKMREESDNRLREEEGRLQLEFSQAASDLRVIAEERKAAEARFEEERRRLEESFLQTRSDMESREARIRGDIESAKGIARDKAREIRESQAEKEESLRVRMEGKLRAERQRLEQQFAISIAQQERARHDLDMAEAARRAATREAERIASELAAAEGRRKTAEHEAAAARQKRLAEQRAAAVEQLEMARRQKEAAEESHRDFSTTVGRIRDAAAPDDRAQPSIESRLRAELEAFQNQIVAAEERVGAAEEVHARAARAQRAAERRLAEQQAAEEELRLKLHEETEVWLEQERSQSEAELERLKAIEARLERVDREKEASRERAARDDESLLDDITSQLGGEEHPGVALNVAQQRAALAREAQTQTQADKAKALEALGRARRQIEALKQSTNS